ncbi:MAG: TIGR00725 family protein [Actinomycetota bacterium]|nr:TIGR00725 family protein [Actinomycetota bacterium]
MTRPNIAVVGGGVASPDHVRDAEAVGRAIAEAGCVLVCGGFGGVMKAACRGARSAGGTTVGILPGRTADGANEFLDIALPTGLGEARNTVIVHSCDALIAVGGEFGTLSEIAFALKIGKPVIGLGTWDLARDGALVDAFDRVSSAQEAVAKALAALR